MHEGRDTPLSFRATVGLGVSFAVLFGTLEALEAAALRSIPHVQAMTKVSLGIFWSAPAAHLLVNAILMVMLGLARFWVLARRASVVAGIFSFAGMTAVIAYSGFVGRLASAMLAAGIAVQVGRLWVRHGRVRLVHQAAAVTAAGIAVVAGIRLIIVIVPAVFHPAAAVAEAGPQPLNTLILVLDTVRADRLSSYGFREITTPALDRVAAEGTLFERAYATSSWTLPSHASLLTGLSSSEHGAATMHDLVDGRQLQQLLQNRGYATGAFVANNIFFVPERGFDAGFDVFEVHHPRSLLARTAFGRPIREGLRRVNVEVSPFRSALEINRRFERWIGSIGSRPFFAVLNYMEAHDPFQAGESRPDLRLWYRTRSHEENRQLEMAYARAIASLDAELGRFFDRSRTSAWWDRTLIVIVSDHGEAISDDSFDHGSDLRVEQIHVPLIMRLPGKVPAGMRVDHPISIADIASTVVELTGVTPMESFPGRSLARWFSSTAHPDNRDTRGILSEVIPTTGSQDRLGKRSVIVGGHQYIIDLDTGREELFDALNDPGGLVNLAADPGNRQILESLREALSRHPREAER